jgi:hypothetical protein
MTILTVLAAAMWLASPLIRAEKRCAAETLAELMLAHTDAVDELREETGEWL